MNSTMLLGDAIICTECTGGFVEDDGQKHPCPVCDGDPVITFATFKEYSRQIGFFSRKLWTCQAELETVKRINAELTERLRRCD